MSINGDVDTFTAPQLVLRCFANVAPRSSNIA
jgi:hypothetical protein